MPWNKCPKCGRHVYLASMYSWDECECGAVVEADPSKGDGIDPRDIHDAVLPEEGPSPLQAAYGAFRVLQEVKRWDDQWQKDHQAAAEA